MFFIWKHLQSKEHLFEARVSGQMVFKTFWRVALQRLIVRNQ